MSPLRYVLITSARNEADHLGRTIRSVISQTSLPEKWIIVSDGSTDTTDEITREFAARHGWIRLIRMPEHADRHFAAKAHCFNAGLRAVEHMPYDIVGNLDADLSFEPDIMGFLLERFERDPSLGVAGIPFMEDMRGGYDYRFTNIEHVSGACQLFRRECFEAVGGYKPIKGGGIDWLAVTTARMMGWKTRTFTEKSVFHHRKIGTGGGGGLSALFHLGIKDYSLGNHPLWEASRALYQMRAKPYGLGGLAIFVGYLWALLRRAERPMPAEVIKFCRREQMQRLGTVLRSWRAALSGRG